MIVIQLAKLSNTYNEQLIYYSYIMSYEWPLQL